MTNFFTSDTHFNHDKIREYCPGRMVLGETVEEMNAGLVRRWNSVVKPTDTVYFIGDAVMGKRVDSLLLIGLLNGDKILIPGNHDGPFKRNFEKPKHTRFREKQTILYEDAGFTIAEQNVRMTLSDGTRVLLCHFPIEGDSTEKDRYLEYRPKPDGSWKYLLCGHIHDLWKTEGNQINVGVDVWDFYPISEDQIIETIKGMKK